MGLSIGLSRLRPRRDAWLRCVVGAALAMQVPCALAREVPADELAGLSLREAPAAIHASSHEEIMRSGATSLIEALRLAPTPASTST
jgi:hypothetical protein